MNRMRHRHRSPTVSPLSARLVRRGFGVVTVAAACVAAVTTPATAQTPALPNLPSAPKPPALPQLPQVQPPPVHLPAAPAPAVPQVPSPGVPSPGVSLPPVPGVTGGGSTGSQSVPGTPGALPGQGGTGYAPGGAGAQDDSGPAARRRGAERRGVNRRLRRSVRSLQGCLPAVSGLERRVLVLRAGLGGRPAGSRRAVARQLEVSPRRVARAEARGLKRLRGAAQQSACKSSPSPIVIERTPWLMPLTAASSGLPLMSMASLAGRPSADERVLDAGAVKGVSRRGTADSLVSGSDTQGSLADAAQDPQPQTVAASASNGEGLLLPLLLTAGLLTLVALYALIGRGRRASTAGGPSPEPEFGATGTGVTAATAAPVAAPATASRVADQQKAEEPEPVADEPVAAEPEPVADEPEPVAAEDDARPGSTAALAPVPDRAPTPPATDSQPPVEPEAGAVGAAATPQRPPSPAWPSSPPISRPSAPPPPFWRRPRARAMRQAASGAAGKAGALTRALLRVRRRR